ncbi:methyltransferase domain-containing protein [Luteimonas sp. SJ-92]|uniref:Methyltransferase domain-containing protein n=1 Tax=Luteimonas salinisoli TaxID=2752307 RepID=A0A853JER7_9GAMM|nr:methyltransferase domain-containing protein [Luteimonas salinisoli]NZA27806.1 methyltransferase domain-containing protein [Luteimonas salinisoli]
MSTRSSDPARRTDDQRQHWDGVAAGWKQWWPTIEQGAQAVSARMLELAAVAPGQRVLDIATGIGEPALLAAARVGPRGRVLATDCSPRMLAIARERAAGLGLANVDFLEMDARELEFPDDSFDAALCRWGISYLPDPPTTAAAIRRLLVPGGSFATSVWQAGPRGRPMVGLAMAAAIETFDLPPPSEPAVPASGSAEAALAQQLVLAGFTDVRVEEVALTLEFRSADDCTQYLMDVSPQFSALLLGRTSTELAEYRQRLGDRLRQYTTADGSVRVPNVAVCAAGRA